ncbi:MAG TPA: BMC domain-containing protein [Firmicutes bacterium]|nr:BMC domain-containing protein [Bacillota bacterium]
MGDRHALAMMEFKSIGRGLECVDGVLKGFPVELILLKIICPGKLLAAITGETAAVRGALQLARSTHSGMTYIDDFFLGNPAPGILAALRGTVPVQRQGALGIIETFTASSGLVAADTAAKAASITLVTIHLARGLAGKAHICLVGSIGAVEVALEAVEKGLEPGLLARTRIIAAPDEAVWSAIS